MESMETIMAEIAERRRPWERDTISEDWNCGYDRLSIEATYGKHVDGEGVSWSHRIMVDWDLEDRFDGAGYAEALSERFEKRYAAGCTDMAAAIAMARMSAICRDYADIMAGKDYAPSKREMAETWAYAAGTELDGGDEIGDHRWARWAEGEIGDCRITILYDWNDEED